MSLCLNVFIGIIFVTLNPGNLKSTTAEPTVPPECDYYIEGLDANIEISSDSEVGELIFELTIEEIAVERKRRRRGLNEEDITMETETQYFELIFVENPWELRVKNCLTAGLNETLSFTLDNAVRTGACESSTTLITVVPAQPLLEGPESVEVDVGDCSAGRTIEVAALQFSNSNSCVSFECTVNCTNDEKLFWIESGTVIKTDIDGINFSLTYILNVVCKDATAVIDVTDIEDENFVDVTFTNTSPCTANPVSLAKSTHETGSSSRTTLPSQVPTTQNEEEKPKGFFQKPGNVAIISTVSGGIIGVAAGVGTVVLASNKCKFRPVTSSSKEEDIEDVD